MYTHPFTRGFLRPNFITQQKHGFYCLSVYIISKRETYNAHKHFCVERSPNRFGIAINALEQLNKINISCSNQRTPTDKKESKVHAFAMRITQREWAQTSANVYAIHSKHSPYTVCVFIVTPNSKPRCRFPETSLSFFSSHTK